MFKILSELENQRELLQVLNKENPSKKLIEALYHLNKSIFWLKQLFIGSAEDK